MQSCSEQRYSQKSIVEKTQGTWDSRTISLIEKHNLKSLKLIWWSKTIPPIALSFAISAKALDIVKWLLDNGVQAEYQHLKDAAMCGFFEAFDVLIEAGANIHYNQDEILFFISTFYNKPYFKRTQLELPLLIAKYNLQKHPNNCGFVRDELESAGCGE